MLHQNPTTTKSWKELEKHYQDIKDVHLNSLFEKNANRKDEFSIAFEALNFDFSKNRITKKTLELLVELAKEQKLDKAIESLFTGEKINTTEERAVLHAALRSFEDEHLKVDDSLIYNEIDQARNKVKQFTEQVISGDWKGHTGKRITDVVNIGIGGSDLGPQMVVKALDFYKNQLNIHFISNIDGDATHAVLNKLNPETTLFVVVSKTFSTIETLTNANTCKSWLLKKGANTTIANHFVAVSANEKAALNFGIEKESIFPMWDWVGGRFSMWGSVGISIALAIGYDDFENFLKGANSVDIHFRKTAFKNNIPVLMGILSVWNINFFKTKSEAVLPYAESLDKFVAYLQQLFMESNGKSIDVNGELVNYETAAVIFGSTGSNAQHSFMQHIHQGTQLIPVDFIGFNASLYGCEKHHNILMANFNAQTEALQKGKSKNEVHLSMKLNHEKNKINKLLPFKVFNGNRVSNTLLLNKLTPYNLGLLIALYEHKVFVQGVIWNINSFDQFGVELGKEMARKVKS